MITVFDNVMLNNHTQIEDYFSRGNEKTLEYFHESYCSEDMNFDEFKDFFNKAWNKPHGFVVINLWDDCTGVYTPAINN